MTNPFLRVSREGDGKTVRKLIQMAHEDIPRDKAAGLANFVGNGKQADAHQLIVRSRRRGEDIETNSYFSMRLADSGTGRVAGFVYAGPPVSWIMSREISLEHRKILAERLVEIQLMAVLERFRHKSIGSMLLADCERRYREQGYTMAMLITSPKASPLLVPWYEKHGYTFERENIPYKVRFWNGLPITSNYNHTQQDQRVAFKPLAPTCTVTEEPDTFTHPSYALPQTYPRAVASGLLD